MVIFIAGASHTGKTCLAQRVLEKYHFPYLSVDHLKMGLIRSGQTRLTPEDDRELEAYLWPIVREMARTAVENRQDLVIEGAYIPFSWREDFTEAELADMRFTCLIMTEGYIRAHFDDIKRHASVIEARGDDSWCTMELCIADNAQNLALSKQYGCPYILIDGEYDVNFVL